MSGSSKKLTIGDHTLNISGWDEFDQRVNERYDEYRSLLVGATRKKKVQILNELCEEFKESGFTFFKGGRQLEPFAKKVKEQIRYRFGLKWPPIAKTTEVPPLVPVVARTTDPTTQPPPTNPSATEAITTPTVEARAAAATRGVVQLPTPTEGIASWDTMKLKLDKLNDILQMPDAKKYVAECANNSHDASATNINNAMQIYLSERSKCYNGLVKNFYKTKADRELIIQPVDLLKHIETRVVEKQPDWSEHKVERLSLLLGKGKERAPQPVHCDTKQLPSQYQDAQKFGIFMLSRNSPGTIYYDMDDVPMHPTVANLKDCWADVPETLTERLSKVPDAVENLSGYGRLLFATHNRRIETAVADQYSVTILESGHPHCAPACKDHRAVFFFTLKQPDLPDKYAYDERSQMSRQKLPFMLYESLWPGSNRVDDRTLTEAERRASNYERQYLVEKFVEYMKESSFAGSRDDTFDFPAEIREAMEAFHDSCEESYQANTNMYNRGQAFAHLMLGND